MNRHSRRTAARAALVAACVGFFAAITVIGQVSDGNPVPDPPALLLDVQR